MVEIIYKPSFIDKYNGLEKDLQAEVLEKIELFKNPRNHRHLKVHKLHGRLRGRYSFSINYKYRIVFSYISKNQVRLLSIGDHDVYK
ncbi:MAG: hypothetical protein A3C79_02555 [Candidatus Taylorbacteria bacterium RIFCSPHIGHO2_02_FULL_45_28]|uniref:Plasmid stabilization protein n=1 Tax=Candidatus Taylorbacteria bacterium RIFCSPHIGHO2_12_FULL_45_16 TaxID=1802315 RepID=A0A1G2MXV3_9BACT|nr:MAG: hypothetical protein A2830_03360 [Candidatus Taylorbacteria bacterium RIFCSPHIGHO2_01_FULL_44_110]OHA25330.1 MAG: hypothetical protein A3C79_02555 [Candidatus Taylorbacteria bacterium RIFCSPHIGHO2_02_FULL_45_28]OHA28717.1 MAG: hypothetical protein A3F51_03020 [Candidatus Taylorbacteria bacterium RIFCSPHIGHO2_12_FULL_45_16]OHA32991.1 MAG: hypothetical protein A3A23_01200 [Candidatus Taylorbacteria bacterium RIFCSPLOWO2_01_FULL_45_59]OHA38480.1 MAG: hypothetical protein A3I98_00710 [Candi